MSVLTTPIRGDRAILLRHIGCTAAFYGCVATSVGAFWPAASTISQLMAAAHQKEIVTAASKILNVEWFHQQPELTSFVESLKRIAASERSSSKSFVKLLTSELRQAIPWLVKKVIREMFKQMVIHVGVFAACRILTLAAASDSWIRVDWSSLRQSPEVAATLGEATPLYAMYHFAACAPAVLELTASRIWNAVAQPFYVLARLPRVTYFSPAESIATAAVGAPLSIRSVLSRDVIRQIVKGFQWSHFVAWRLTLALPNIVGSIVDSGIEIWYAATQSRTKLDAVEPQSKSLVRAVATLSSHVTKTLLQGTIVGLSVVAAIRWLPPNWTDHTIVLDRRGAGYVGFVVGSLLSPWKQ